jgi:hypothetical protein
MAKAVDSYFVDEETSDRQLTMYLESRMEYKQKHLC